MCIQWSCDRARSQPKKLKLIWHTLGAGQGPPLPSHPVPIFFFSSSNNGKLVLQNGEEKFNLLNTRLYRQSIPVSVGRIRHQLFHLPLQCSISLVLFQPWKYDFQLDKKKSNSNISVAKLSCSTVLPKLWQDIFAFYVDLIFTSSTDRRSQSRSVRHTALKDNFFVRFWGKIYFTLYI